MFTLKQFSRTEIKGYRAYIDGMRALAILSVITYHAFPNSVRGGFVGVDIFFVISGYLITSIILRSLDSGKFSITSFYIRRIRRIFPALLLVLLSCLVIGWFLLLPSEYMQVGKHIASGAGFVSNLVLWGESGYFDAAAEGKPLLHLWSLGIEEQFYVFWPILLPFAKKQRLNILYVIVLVLLASFTLNIIQTSPISYSAFYSPATRMWELAVGGALAYIMLYRTEDGSAYSWCTHIILCSGRWAEFRAFVGFALIVLAAFWINRESPFPGWRALLPTVGAALIISAGPSAWFNRKVLSNQILVFVGLISYPLYLWHWPLLSFAHIKNSGVLSTELRLELLLASVALACITFVLVEKPIKASKAHASTVLTLLGLMIVVGSSGGLVYLQDGFGQRSVSKWSLGTVVSHDNEASTITPDVKFALSSFALFQKRVADAKLAMSPTRRLDLDHPNPYLDESWNGRLTAVRTSICDLDLNQKYETLKDDSVCGGVIEGKKNIVVIGDSIAADTYFWLRSAYPEYNFIQKTGTGCNLERGSANSKACLSQIERGISIFQSGQ